MSDPSDKAAAQADTIGRAFIEVLGDPAISWRDRPAAEFTRAVATRARELDAAKGATPPAQAAEAVDADTRRLDWLASLPMVVEFDYDQPGPGILISFSAPAGTRASLDLRATCDAAIAAIQAGE